MPALISPAPATGGATAPPPDATAIRAVSVPVSTPAFDDAAAERGAGTPRPPATGLPPTAAPPPERATGPYGGTWPSRFAQALAETLAGSRPPAQLAPWTTEQARSRISQLGHVLASGRQPRVRRVVAASPADGVVELAVVVDLGARVRALAVRLERQGSDDWRCTAVEAA